VLVLAEATPNPRTLKFVPAREALPRAAGEYARGGDASGSPLAERILRIEGVERVLVGEGFVSVTSDGRDWSGLRECVAEAIRGHALSNTVPDDREGGAAEADREDTLVERMKSTLDSRIRPALAADGGDVTFVDFRDGILSLRMHGACNGCPSSSSTLRHGILATLRRFYPEIADVRAV